jgi:hypothetical protein
MGDSYDGRGDTTSERAHGSSVALNLLDPTRKPLVPMDPNPTETNPGANPSGYLTSSSHPQAPLNPPTPDPGAHGPSPETPGPLTMYASSNPSFKLTSSFFSDEPVSPVTPDGATHVTGAAKPHPRQAPSAVGSPPLVTDVESPFEDEGLQAISPTAKPRVSFGDGVTPERVPPSGESGGEGAGGAQRGKTFEHKSRSLMDTKAEGLSLHGEEAYRRQGLSELLFFAAVGDVDRCKKIVKKYNLDVGCPSCKGLCNITSLGVRWPSLTALCSSPIRICDAHAS